MQNLSGLASLSGLIRERVPAPHVPPNRVERGRALNLTGGSGPSISFESAVALSGLRLGKNQDEGT